MFHTGDSVAGVGVVAGGAPGSVLPGAGAALTAVLVFSSACAHCDSVAPQWAEWMSRPHEGVRVLAVSPEPLEDARSYAASHGWQAEVASTRDGQLTDEARRLTSRAPWLFLVGRGGRILFEAHGARLAELDAAIRETAEVLGRRRLGPPPASRH